MTDTLQRIASRLALIVASLALSGCLIDGLSSNTSGGLTTLTAGVTLQQPAGCVVDGATQSTTCTPVIMVSLPGGVVQTYPVSITLRGYASPLPFYDPLILQVPATMSDFAGSITVGPPGVTPGTPLIVTAGLTSIPIDANTSLVAEAGMQLVIIDFQAPANAPFGQYGLTLQFRGTASSVKFIFAGKVTVDTPSGLAKATQDYYLPIFPCVTSFAQVSAIPIPLVNPAQLLQFLASASGCVGKVYDLPAASSPTTVDVIEYYNASLDHYFITWVPAEIAILDAGTTTKGWVRTGKSFKAYTSAQATTSDICRYYIPPGLGDSHFFGRGTAECNATGANNPSFVLEDPVFTRMFLPNQGVCPAGTANVYRAFSNRPDANHRYMTDPNDRTLMVARGWLAEGDGPNLVVMCAPL